MSTVSRIKNHSCLAIIFCTLFFVILTSSCSEQKMIEIGYVAGITGRHSELAIGVRNGVLLAVEELNNNGGINGHTVELSVHDNQGLPSETAKIIESSIDKKIPVIIGPLLSKMAPAVIEASSNIDILIISPTVSTDLLKDIDDNFLRLIPESSFQGEAIATAVLAKKHKQIAIIYDVGNKEYTQPIVDTFKKKIRTSSTEIVYINQLNDREKSSNDIAMEIVESGCDSLFFITSSIDAGEIAQQVWKKKKGIQLYGAFWVKSGRIIEVGGRSVEGMIFSTIFERFGKTDDYKKFAGRYQEQFKTKPNFTSVYAYESVMVMADGMRISNSFSPSKIKAAIINKGTFSGLEEPFLINKFGDVQRSKSFVKIENGQFIKVDF